MKHFVKDSYFEVVADVSATWLQVKNIPDFKTVVGVELFTRMIEIAPDAWSVFPWSKGIGRGVNLAENKRFVIFAKRFVSMLDMAIDMLGPDLEMVEGQLQQLGIRHISYGVMPKHYPLMGKALLNTLEHLLGDKFDDKRHDSWNAIYTFMSVTMMQGAFQELVRVYEEKQNESSMRVAGRKNDESSTASSRRTSRNGGSNETVVTAAMSSQNGEDDHDQASLVSSLDDEEAHSTSAGIPRRSSSTRCSSSGKGSDYEHAKKNSTNAGDNRKKSGLFSSSDFVKRFTRGTKA